MVKATNLIVLAVKLLKENKLRRKKGVGSCPSGHCCHREEQRCSDSSCAENAKSGFTGRCGLFGHVVKARRDVRVRKEPQILL